MFKNIFKKKCPSCGSTRIIKILKKIYGMDIVDYYLCDSCYHEWK